MFVADLSAAITSEAMIPVLANADVQQRLIPLLPEAAELPKTEAELRETMHSPQFHQVLLVLILQILYISRYCVGRFKFNSIKSQRHVLRFSTTTRSI